MMRTLRAIGAIFAAPTRLDTQQRAELHFVPGPVSCVNLVGLRKEIKKGQAVQTVEFVKRHHSPGS